ncbi:MAG TPA: PQQ-binding-like beta-propeller repeat protein, partial [Ktedonobacterales bacterium]|nr:PQQ-binding-like beta-propeller repeat protein [Ktedonobacterales bacterium]
ILRRARGGRPGVWVGLVFRGALIAGLLAIGAASLVYAPPGPSRLVNRPAPVSSNVIVVYLQQTNLAPPTLIAVNARTGARLWSRAFQIIEPLLFRLAPDVALVASDTGYLEALRVSDGATLWTQAGVETQIGLFTASDVASDGNSLFLISPISKDTVQIEAVNAHTGTAIWHGVPSMPDFVPSALALDGATLFIAGQSPTDSAVSVIAVNKATGALQWQAPRNALTSLRSVQALMVTLGNIIVLPDGFGLQWYLGSKAESFPVALRERDGAQAWTMTLNAKPNDLPTILEEARDNSNLYLLYAPTSVLYSPCVGDSFETCPATLAAFDMQTGRMRWSRLTSFVDGNEALTVYDGVLLRGLPADYGFMADFNYNQNGSLLFAYDAASGRPLWRDNTPRIGVTWNLPVAVAPTGVNSTVYLIGLQSSPYLPPFGDCNFNCGYTWLYAVNVHSGAAWWRAPAGNVKMTRFIL